MLLPNCSLQWPSGLFSPDDRPLITFDGPSQISIEFPECSVSGSRQWQIPARSAFIEGALRINTLSILVGHTVYRAGFANDSTPERRFFDSGEFDSEFPLQVRGLPRAQIRLGVSDTLDTLPFDLAQTFDVAGLKRMSSFAVRDALKSYSKPAGAIAIWSGRSWVQTGAVLLNFAALSRWLFAEQQDQAAPWLSLLENTLAVWLKEVLHCLSNDTPARRFQAPNTLPTSAQNWADDIELMLLVFAHHPPGETTDPFADCNIDHLDPQMVKALRWVWAARGLVEREKSAEESDANLLIDQFPQWLPPRAAWQQTMRDLLRKLRRQHDLDPIIAEWAAEACPPMRNELTSQIAGQERGRDLTEAYICSQQGNQPGAYLLIDAIEHGTPSGLVLDLALLLKNIIRVRNNLSFQAPDAPVHKKLRPFLEGLSQLARGQAVAPPPNGVLASQFLKPEKLPLHQDDIALLRRAVGVS